MTGRDIPAALRAAGWEADERTTDTFWILPGVSPRVPERQAVRILDGELCPALFYHGPGHQSRSRCELTGEHDVHETHYGGYDTRARWRTGSYTDKLRAGGHDFDPRSYPETMGMSGYFDEPEDDDAG